MNLLDKLNMFDRLGQVTITEMEFHSFETALKESKVNYSFTQNQGQDSYYVFYKE